MSLPADVLDLKRAAHELGVSYHWLQSHWRTVEGFPAPFFGQGKGQRPRWSRKAILEYRDGRRWTHEERAPSPPSRVMPPANDPRPTALADPAAALLAAAGGWTAGAAI